MCLLYSFPTNTPFKLEYVISHSPTTCETVTFHILQHKPVENFITRAFFYVNFPKGNPD